jgi:hypothetical protein
LGEGPYEMAIVPSGKIAAVVVAGKRLGRLVAVAVAAVVVVEHKKC